VHSVILRVVIVNQKIQSVTMPLSSVATRPYARATQTHMSAAVELSLVWGFPWNILPLDNLAHSLVFLVEDRHRARSKCSE